MMSVELREAIKEQYRVCKLIDDLRLDKYGEIPKEEILSFSTERKEYKNVRDL